VFWAVSFASVHSVVAADQTNPPQPGAHRTAPDFLFGRPTKSLAIRASWLTPREGGDLFSFVRSQLTVGKGDFKTAAISGDVGFAVSSRMSILVGFEANQKAVNSEYRKYLGSDGLPINQSTSLYSQLLQGTLTVALFNPGQRISRYAWIPRTVTPFVGAGGGLAHYSFTQNGQFVDYQTLSIFTDAFKTRGWVPTAHALAGVDIHAWRNVYVTVQERYVRAHARPGTDFVGFDRLDLSGFRTESGLSFVF
jgi:hypothetical protein